ncbi:MAG: DNA photolyase [Rhodobacterales bacterium]|nr:DNA photolyase [Rhodobacterales bacterium]MDX5413775.1 DNA photolyase [Rhodobacterales bacterium]
MSIRTVQDFTPTRTAGLERLTRFIPHAGADYARMRNHDLGAGQHVHVSTLSPWIRHRLVTEAEVLRAVLARHSLTAAEKFVQEVYWRTYWKGWLEQRPAVWEMYQQGLRAALDQVQTQSGLRGNWADACTGQTGIDAFDHWAQELVQTGYLHNHARMWFASIWIFTLRLPWELGADFFLRHLLDGDPASNTLGWRWVAGLQTRGKTYLARPDNIETYTGRRFRPKGLASVAMPLNGPDAPRVPLPAPQTFDPAQPTALLLHDDDLSPAWLFDQGLAPIATGCLITTRARSPLHVAPHLEAFVTGAMADVTERWKDRLGPLAPALTAGEAVADWARTTGARQIVTPYAPTGSNAAALRVLEAALTPDGIRLIRLQRRFDSTAWPHATAGFFRFKEKIPTLVGELKGIGAI